MESSFAEWVEDYLSCLRVMNYSPGTVRSTSYILGWFAQWCLNRGVQNPQAVGRTHLEQFQHWLYRYRKPNERPLALETQQVRLIVIRRFFFWLVRRGALKDNPAATLELPRGQHRLPKGILSPGELARILSQVDLGSSFGLRDRAMLEVFYATGIRRMELCNLKVYDLNMRGEVLRVCQGKGGRDRMVPISSRAISWVSQYLSRVRDDLLKTSVPDPGYLFLSRLGGKLAVDTVGRLVRKYARDAGLKKAGACHLFRHTMATEMLENGADIRYIQEMLGHQRLNSTQIYTQVSIRKLKEVHAQTHPGAQKIG